MWLPCIDYAIGDCVIAHNSNNSRHTQSYIWGIYPSIRSTWECRPRIQNVFKLEGVINSWESCFSFLNRSIPIFPKEKIVLKPKEQKLVKVEAPFIDEILSLATVKILDKIMQSMVMFKLKFTWNLVVLDIMNISSEIVIFNPKEAIGILDLRSLGDHNIQQGVLQQNLSKSIILNQWRMCVIISIISSWLDTMDERKHMSDREILEKYIDLGNLCLHKEEKEEVMDMYTNKEAFSLRDETGRSSTCPNIEVEISVTDKSPFLLAISH